MLSDIPLYAQGVPGILIPLSLTLIAESRSMDVSLPCSAITEFLCAMSTAMNISGIEQGTCASTHLTASASDAWFIGARLAVEYILIHFMLHFMMLVLCISQI